MKGSETMTDGIIIALIGFAGSTIGTLLGIVVNTKLTNYRLEQLENKVNKHNNLIDRTYKLEETTKLQAEKIAVANHRIDDLEEARR